MAFTDEIMPFISGGTSNMSIEELRRRQAVAAATAAQKRAYPKTLGEGIAALGEGLGERFENDRLRAAEARYAGQRLTPPGTAAAGGPATVGARPAPDAAVAPSLFDPRPVLGPRDKIAAALEGRPEEVASLDPTLGAETPPGSPDGQILSDAAPIGGAGDQLALSEIAPARVPLPTSLSPRGAAEEPAPPPVAPPVASPIAPQPRPRPRLPPQALPLVPTDPDVVNPDQPTVVDNIRPMSVRTQIAQAPAGVIPGAYATPGAVTMGPNPVPPLAVPGATERPPAPPPAPGGRAVLDIPPAPTPLAFPSPGPEPRRPGATPDMNYYREAATNRNMREDLRAEAARRYQQLQTQQEADYVRKWTDWRTDVDKEREYKLADPQRRQQLVQGHLANIEKRQSLEGEGFFPLTPEQRAQFPSLANLPPGQTVYTNRRGELKLLGGAGTTVNVDTKAEGKGLEELQKKMAGHMVEQFEAGNAAGDDLKTLAQMRVLTSKVNTGPEAVVKQFAGRWGIKTEGISNIEALNAVINRVVPTQRVPGSGTTSDFDAKMFAASVPHLMNTPDGNNLIMDTMEGAARNKMARAEIAGKVISGQLTIAQGTSELLKLQGEARALSDRVASHLETKGVKLDTVLPSDTTMKDDAREWLKNNPSDPRAPEIRRRLGL